MALCITHAVLCKLSWLSERKSEAEWIQKALIEHFHLDNAKEFHSETLRGAVSSTTGIGYRSVRAPHYGGHIEQLLGTVMGKMHLLPGATPLCIGRHPREIASIVVRAAASAVTSSSESISAKLIDETGLISLSRVVV